MNIEEYKEYIIYKVIPHKINRYLKSKSKINRDAILNSICKEIEALDEHIMKDSYYNTKQNVKYKIDN